MMDADTIMEVDMIIFSPTELFAMVFLCNLGGFAIALSLIALYQ